MDSHVSASLLQQRAREREREARRLFRSQKRRPHPALRDRERQPVTSCVPPRNPGQEQGLKIAGIIYRGDRLALCARDGETRDRGCNSASLLSSECATTVAPVALSSLSSPSLSAVAVPPSAVVHEASGMCVCASDREKSFQSSLSLVQRFTTGIHVQSASLREITRHADTQATRTQTERTRAPAEREREREAA